MSRTSSRTSSPEKQQPTSLSALISSLNTISYTSTITTLTALVPGLTPSLSPTGERLIHHEAHAGPANLNDLARKWMRTGFQCRHQNAPFTLRLQQQDLLPYFQKLYESTENDIKRYRFARFCNGWREFSIVCAHCVGHPWVAVPEGESHVDNALYVEEGVYRRVWPGKQAVGGCAGVVGGEMKRWDMVTREQLEDAVKRGIES